MSFFLFRRLAESTDTLKKENAIIKTELGEWKGHFTAPVKCKSTKYFYCCPVCLNVASIFLLETRSNG